MSSITQDNSAPCKDFYASKSSKSNEKSIDELKQCLHKQIQDLEVDQDGKICIKHETSIRQAKPEIDCKPKKKLCKKIKKN